MTASRPTIIVEVSSPGAPVLDDGVRLREYQTMESVDTVMRIKSEVALVKVHRRQQDGTWTEETIEEFGVAIPLPPLATSITLNEVYDTVEVSR
jgi:Uma2 family endonuclease